MPDLVPLDPDARLVYDADSGEDVPVTAEMVHRAARAEQAIQAGTLLVAAAVRVIADEKLYLVAGCSSFKEYADTRLPVGYRDAKRYLTIGRRLSPLLGLNESLEGKPTSLDDGEEGTPASLALGALGPSKLYELVSHLDDDALAEAVEAQEVKLPSGRTVSFQELQEMTRAELRKEFAEEKRALRERNAALQEQAKLAASERDAEAQARRREAQRMEDAELNEKLYGPVATNVRMKRERLDLARERLDDVRRALVKAGITPEDPDELVDRLHETINAVYRTWHDMRSQYLETLTASDLTRAGIPGAEVAALNPDAEA